MVRIIIALLLATLSSYSVADSLQSLNQDEIYKLKLNIFSDTDYSLTSEEHIFLEELFTDFDPEAVKDRELLIDALYLSDILIDHYTRKYAIGHKDYQYKIKSEIELSTYELAQDLWQKKIDYINSHMNIEETAYSRYEPFDDKSRQARKELLERRRAVSEAYKDNETFLYYLAEDDVFYRHYRGTEGRQLRGSYNHFFNNVFDDQYNLSIKQLIDLYSYLTIKHYWAFDLDILIQEPRELHSFDIFGPALHSSIVFFHVLTESGQEALARTFAKKMFTSKKSIRTLKETYGLGEPYQGIVEKIIDVVGDPEGIKVEE
ncbi:MAG: hypothetical protein C0623_13585 [Desulfuromonas sp.]|nr:MAG: hypothetical protein C0623_13585 [Desulfuromonas sp.]